MAKLIGVTTLNMQDGDITKVSYQGEEYTKVVGESMPGDVLLRISHTLLDAVIIGNFYDVTTPKYGEVEVGITWYIDEDGDSLRGASNRFVTFRKSPAAVSAPFAEMITSKICGVDAKIDAVEGRVSALEVARESSKPTPTFNEGNRVKALHDGEFGKVMAGEYGFIYEIFEGADDPHSFRVVSDGISDYFRPQDLELSPEVQPKKQPLPDEGDIVVITGNTNCSRNEIGDIGKVGAGSLIDEDEMVVDVPARPSKTYNNGNFTKFSEMRPATDAEKAEYEKAVEQVKKGAVFTKAGRKPFEYRRGDIGRITDTHNSPGRKFGELVEVVSDYKLTGVPKAVRLSDDYVVSIEIVCFAEDRKDIAKGGR